MRNSREKLVGEMDKDNLNLKKIGRASKWAAGSALVLAGLTGPGVFFGWRNARADEARAEQAQQELSETENALESNHAKLDGYLAELGLACRKTVGLYLHDGANTGFSSGAAQTLVFESGNCGYDQSVVSISRELDNIVVRGEEERDEAQKDYESKLRDAAQNNELWQGALTTMASAVAITTLCSVVLVD